MKPIPGSSPVFYRRRIASPVGELRLYASDRGLAAILWRDDTGRHLGADCEILDGGHPVLDQAERQLGEYFAGRRRVFELPLEFLGTEFQCRVWNALLTIPFGETRSYSEIAKQIGAPDAVRAVGAANGRNPLSIVAPCHRVIGAGGDLTGFGGGLPNKAWLLAHESPQQDLLGGSG
jgi:methylated-DNA-[protein]-cysteine S-methyltransferase